MVAAFAELQTSDAVFQVPKSAHSLAGFRQWIDTLPEKTKVSYIQSEVFIEVSSDCMIQIPASAHTLAGFRKWLPTLPEKWNVALVGDDVVIEMGNEDIFRHVKLKGVIFGALLNIVNAEDLGEIFQDGGLLTHEATSLSCNPDGIAVLWETFDSGRAQVIEEADRFPEIRGTPDWVLEVVSPGSVKKDTKQFRDAYHAAGIPEYWLVDARRDPLAFTILHWRKSGYAAAAVKGGWQMSRVFGRRFRIVTSERRGLRHYVLESK